MYFLFLNDEILDRNILDDCGATKSYFEWMKKTIIPNEKYEERMSLEHKSYELIIENPPLYQSTTKGIRRKKWVCFECATKEERQKVSSIKVVGWREYFSSYCNVNNSN